MLRKPSVEYDQEFSANVSADDECGVNLEDDSAFQNFFFESQGTPERFDGKNTTPPEPPEWRAVKKQAIEYLKKTRDLNLLSVLSQAVLNTEGIVKFEQCLSGISQLVKNNWTALYPSLDEDDGDPLERISALGHLSDKAFIVNTLKTIPIAHSKVFGNLTLQLIDRSVNPAIKGDSNLGISQIKGIFKDANSDEINNIYLATKQCIGHLNDINQTFIEQAGSEYNVNFDMITEVLTHMINTLDKYVEIKATVVESDEQIAGDNNSTSSSNPSATDPTASLIATFDGTNMKLNSRQDVERCFELILSYYNEVEPSSPIPILIKRSKKLVNSDFLDIVKDIFPDALEQVHKLGGITDPNEEQASDDASTSGGSW